MKRLRREVRKRARSFHESRRSSKKEGGGGRLRRRLSFSPIPKESNHGTQCRKEICNCLRCLNGEIEQLLELLRTSCDNQIHYRAVEEELLDRKEQRLSKN